MGASRAGSTFLRPVSIVAKSSNRDKSTTASYNGLGDNNDRKEYRMK